MKFFKSLFGVPGHQRSRRSYPPDLSLSCKCGIENHSCEYIALDAAPESASSAMFLSVVTSDDITVGRGVVLDESDLLTLRGFLDNVLHVRGYPMPTYGGRKD